MSYIETANTDNCDTTNNMLKCLNITVKYKKQQFKPTI